MKQQPVVLDLTGDDKAQELVLDGLFRWYTEVAPTYDPPDQQEYIDAANRIADMLGCHYTGTVGGFNCDGKVAD